MTGSGKRNAASQMQDVVLKVLPKICLAIFICNLALCTEAFRSGQLSSADTVVNNMAFPNDLIAENPNRLYEQTDDGTNSGKTTDDSDLLPHATSTVDANINDYECSYQTDFQHTQESDYLPNGLPIFRVTFTNTCLDCQFSNVIIACGDFTSGIFVNPAIFRRLSANYCLLNNGKPVPPQNTISFEYISTFQYPMTVRRAKPSCAPS